MSLCEFALFIPWPAKYCETGGHSSTCVGRTESKIELERKVFSIRSRTLSRVPPRQDQVPVCVVDGYDARSCIPHGNVRSVTSPRAEEDESLQLRRIRGRVTALSKINLFLLRRLLRDRSDVLVNLD